MLRTLALLISLAISSVGLLAAPTIGGVVNAASFQPGPLAPGTLISVFGTNMASGTAAAESIPLPTVLAGSRLTLSGVDIPLLYVSAGQINAQIPYGVAVGSRVLQLRTQAGETAQFNLTIGTSSPAVFSWTSDGKGEAVALHASYAPVRRQPGMFAAPGEVILLYCTGLGDVSNAPPLGGAGPGGPLAHVIAETKVFFNGIQAQVDFAGLAPGFAGLYQINVRIPTQLAGTVEMLIDQGGTRSLPLSVNIGGPFSIRPYYAGVLANFTNGGIWTLSLTRVVNNPATGFYSFNFETHTSAGQLTDFGTVSVQWTGSSPRFTATLRSIPSNSTWPVVIESFEAGIDLEGRVGPYSGNPWDSPVRFLALATDPPAPPPTPPPPGPLPTTCLQLFGAQIFAGTQFLGVIDANRSGVDSIANPYGLYGGRHAVNSIFNAYGLYGGKYSLQSPFNALSVNPPIIYRNGVPIAYLTANQFKTPRIDPYAVAECVGRLADTPPR